MGRKALWFGISAALMIPGIIAIAMCFSRFGTPVKLGIDFTGGTLVQLRFEKAVTVEELRSALDGVTISGNKVEAEIQEVLETADRQASASVPGSTLILRTATLDRDQLGQLRQGLMARKSLGAFEPERVETVGPRIGSDPLPS